MTKKTTEQFKNKASIDTKKEPLIKREAFEQETPLDDYRETGCLCGLFRPKNKPLLSLEIYDEPTTDYKKSSKTVIRK